MKYWKTISSLAFAMLLALAVVAQTAPSPAQPEMADAMRSNGKIYVVVAALTLIFIGIIVYLISLNRKLNKLEKTLKDFKK